jgi:hypothetical protein
MDSLFLIKMQQGFDRMLLRVRVAFSPEYGTQIDIIEDVPVTNQKERPILIRKHSRACFARSGSQEAKAKHELAVAIYVVTGAVRTSCLERREHRGQFRAGVSGIGQLAYRTTDC